MTSTAEALRSIQEGLAFLRRRQRRQSAPKKSAEPKVLSENDRTFSEPQILILTPSEIGQLQARLDVEARRTKFQA